MLAKPKKEFYFVWTMKTPYPFKVMCMSVYSRVDGNQESIYRTRRQGTFRAKFPYCTIPSYMVLSEVGGLYEINYICWQFKRDLMSCNLALSRDDVFDAESNLIFLKGRLDLFSKCLAVL